MMPALIPALSLPLRFFAAGWMGLLLGVSGLATVAKFQAVSLSLPVALDVGRATFRMLAQVELALLCLMAFGIAVTGLRRGWLALWLVLASARAFQSLWLLPILFAQVDSFLLGIPPSPGFAHQTYVLVEGLKVLALTGCVVLSPLRLPSPVRLRSSEKSPRL